MSNETALSSKPLQKAGDVIVDYITIISRNQVALNVTPQFVSFEITESIFEHYITGIVTIKDSEDLTNFFPLIGNEYLELAFHTPQLGDSVESAQYKKTFFIYRISDKIKQGDRESIYQISVISPEAIVDGNTRVSRTFRGTGEEIMQKILYEELCSDKLLVFNETKNNIIFISNYWHPSKCIDYLSENAISKEGDSSSYLFFEDRGGFVWATLNSLVTFPSDIHFRKARYTPQTQSSFESTAQKDILSDYETIIGLRLENGYDFFKRTKSGFYGGEIISYDPNTHQYIHSRSGVDFEGQNHLNSYSPTPANSPVTTGGYVIYRPYVTQNFDNQTAGIEDTNIPYKVGRQQTISQLGANKVHLKVHGRSDYTVGKVVLLEVEKDKQISKDDTITYDPLISGRYIIASIKHQVNPVEHICLMELMKDSYIRSIDTSGYETPDYQPKA